MTTKINSNGALEIEKTQLQAALFFLQIATKQLADGKKSVPEHFSRITRRFELIKAELQLLSDEIENEAGLIGSDHIPDTESTLIDTEPTQIDVEQPISKTEHIRMQAYDIMRFKSQESNKKRICGMFDDLHKMRKEANPKTKEFEAEVRIWNEVYHELNQ